MIEIKTDRLFLRPININDAEAVFKYRSDAETNKFQGFIPKKVGEVNQFISKVCAEINIPETWFQFVIIENTTNKIIGDVGLHFLDENQVEIGCTLAEKSQGRGYANETLKAVIDYIFNDLNKHRIIGSIDPENTSSIKMLTRIGFRKEAHFKESLLIQGKWVDDVVYAILKSEWQ